MSKPARPDSTGSIIINLRNRVKALEEELRNIGMSQLVINGTPDPGDVPTWNGQNWNPEIPPGIVLARQPTRQGEVVTWNGSVWVAQVTPDPEGTLPATQQDGDWLFTLADIGTVVEATGTGQQTFTVPPAGSDTAPDGFPVNCVIEIYLEGPGPLTIAAGTGVSIRSKGNLMNLADTEATAGLRQRIQDEWVLSGDLA